MINCAENNYTKIGLSTSLIFSLGGENVYSDVLENIINKLNITDAEEFFSYIASKSTGRSDIDGIINKLSNVAFETKKINIFSFNDSIVAASAKLAEAISAPESDLQTQLDSNTAFESNIDSNVIIDVDEDNAEIPVILPDEANMTKTKGVKNLVTVYKNYFLGDLLRNPVLIENSFKKLVSRNWLSTRADVKIIDNFDSEKVKNNIKTDAANTVTEYYRNSAEAVSSLGGIDNLLFYSSISRIPNGAEKIISDFETDSEISFYKYEYTNGNNIIYVVVNDVFNIDMHEVHKELEIQSEKEFSMITDEVELTPMAYIAPNLRSPQINKYTASKNMSNKNLLEAFFSIIIIEELDTFINGISPELDSMTMEYVRTSYARTDVAGSNMETKMLRLAVNSTPKVLGNSDNTEVNMSINSIRTLVGRDGGTIADKFKQLDLIQTIDSEDHNIFNYTTAKGKSYTNVVINIGPTNVVFTYDYDTKKWGIQFPDSTTLQTTMFDSGSALTKNLDVIGQKVSTIFQNNVNDIIFLLNDYTNDIDTFKTVINSSIQLQESKAKDFINSINTREVTLLDNDSINVSVLKNTDDEGFLRMADVITSAGFLANIPEDIHKASTFLFRKSMGKGTDANVARALYYKFYKPGTYTITEINPVTGMLETVTHMSVYEKALQFNDAAAWNSLRALQVQLSSTVVDNKVFLDNGYLVKSAMENANNINHLISAIDYEGLDKVHQGQISLVNEDLKNKFKVTTSNGGNNNVISYYKQGISANAVPTVEFSVSNVNINITQGDLTYEVINDILKVLKVPIMMRSVNLYDALKLALRSIDDTSTSLNVFYGKLIALRLANSTDDKGKFLFSKIEMTKNIEKKVKYTFNDNLRNFIPALEEALDRLHTRAFQSVFQGPKGTKFSMSIYKNLSKDMQSIVDKLILNYLNLPDTYMYKDSNLLSDFESMIIKGTLTRLGLKVGTEGKDPSDMNQQELATTLISSFIQHAGYNNFKEGLFSNGTMADRSKLDQFIVSINDSFGDIAPYYTEDGVDYLDENLLRSRLITTQQKAFSGLQSSIVTSWKKVLIKMTTEGTNFSENILHTIDNLSTLRDVYELLQILELDYTDTLFSSGLIDNFSIIKKTVTDDLGKSKNIASINYSMVQISEIMLGSDVNKQNLYIDMYQHEFNEYIKDVNYKISAQEVRKLEERFTFLKDAGKNKYDIAQELLLKLYFYNDSAVEQELAQFGMGSIFQYHKSKDTPLFEEMNTVMDITAMTDEDKLDFIRNKDFGNNININTPFELLSEAGPVGRDVSVIKSILESNMINSVKLNLIEYLDIFSQLSPMYIDRVKRNQANGTSGIHPILADKNVAGSLLGQITNKLVVEDPEGELFALNSGAQTIKPYDGGQLAAPSYFIRLNNSIGNDFSNFKSNSVLKSINASKTEEGVSMYVKSATFSLFNGDPLIYGTAEHNSMHELMMSKEKFDQYDENFEGLYLIPEEFIKTPLLAPYEYLIDVPAVLRHGEYLGEIIVELKTDNLAKRMLTSKLLLDIKRGEILVEDILNIKTNKVLVDVNTKLDLFNYYGGALTNIELLSAKPTSTEKEAFETQFPFGWVEHQLVEIMSNYKGIKGDYPIRDAEISLLDFVSTTKTGRKHVNPATVLTDKYVKEEDIVTSKISNDQLYLILQAEHESDVTQSQNISKSDEDVTVSMMTQPISNAAMEGSTIDDVNKMEQALSSLSTLQLDKLQEEVNLYTIFTEKGVKHDTAERHHAVELLKKALSTLSNADTPLEMLGTTTQDAVNVSFDLQMIAPKLRSVINAEYNRRAIKTRFPGGQYVLSPIQHQMKTYMYNGAKGLVRNAMNTYEDRDNSDYSINGILKHEITDKQFNGTLSDTSWRLKVIDTIEQLKAEHSPLDYVYETRTKKAIRVAELLKRINKEGVISLSDDLNNGKYMSPWLEKSIDEKSINGFTGKNVEGEHLQWMNYYQNGISLYDTEEFQSYMLAGKAPKALSALDTIGEKLAFFKNELNSTEEEVPIFMWTRFINQLKEDTIIDENDTEDIVAWKTFVHNLKGNADLTTAPVLSKSVVQDNYTDFKATVASLDSEYSLILLENFFQYIEEFKATPQKLTNMFRIQLEHKLEEENWEYSESEFFMPPQHMSAYLITYGDSVQDIVGTQEQPDLVKLVSILGLSEDERVILERNYVYSGNPQVTAIRHKIENSKHEEAQRYLELRKQQQQHMRLYFKSKIRSIDLSIDKATKDELKGIKSRAPLLLLRNSLNKRSTSVASTQKLINELLNTPNVLENLQLVTVLETVNNLLNNNNTVKASQLINMHANRFISKWSTSLASNFEKSLTFITSRIPADAKHQTTVGKIKNFVYSTKNAIYSPIELIALSGADFDIDKQNNMTWNVDSMGKIVSWQDVVDAKGNLNLSTLTSTINSEVNDLKTKLTRLGYSDKDIFKKELKYRQSKLDHLSKAAQNYVLHKLMRVSGSSKNALEAATITAMTKLGIVKDYMASFEITKADIKDYALEVIDQKDKKLGNLAKHYKPSKALFDLIKKKQLAIPFTPSTKMLYEKVNMDGKMGIAIYASAIKAYTTIFKAALSNNVVEKYNDKLKNEVNFDGAFKDIKSFNKSLLANINSEELKYIKFNKTSSDKPIRLVWKNSTTGLFETSQDLEYPANTEKFIPKTKGGYPALNTKLAKEAYKELRFATSARQEANIILKYKQALDSDTNIRNDNQAWKDLAELLSASTDNAKEMILSVIGANNTTSSIIATMIVMGGDLQSILLLINDPIIKDIVKEFEESKTLIQNDTDFVISFKKRLIKKMGEYKSITTAKSAQLRSLVKQDLIKRNIIPKSTKAKETAEDKALIEAETKVQRNLYTQYNPAKQIELFNNAATEFSNLSGALKINTGMVNSELDNFNYLLKVEKALKVNKVTGSLADFLTDEPARNKMIKQANKNKVAFNIPYILFQNKVFFAHLKTLYKSNETVKSLTYTADILYSNIRPKIHAIGKYKLEKTDMYDYLNLLSNTALSTYYNKKNTIIAIPGFKSFNLAIATERLDFIKNIAKIKNILTENNPALLNNIIVEELQANTLKVNKETGDSLLLLDGINTTVVDQGIIESYKIAMEVLKEDSPILYDVLFNYSLIIDKGALSKSSIAILFGAEPYKSFNEHLLHLKNSGEMHGLISSMDPAVLNVILPMTLKELSTLQGFKNKNLIFRKDDTSRFYAEDEYAEDINSGNNMVDMEMDEWDFADEEAYLHMVKTNKMALKFDVSDMNAMYDNKSYDTYPVFKSKTNGLTYMMFDWGGLKSYVPITQNIPSIVGNIDIKTRIQTDNTLRDTIKNVGYDYGWEILLDDGTKGRLLKYKDNNLYYVLAKNANSKSELRLVEADIIKAHNPQFQLYEDFIKVKYGGFKAAKTPQIFFDKNNNVKKEGDIGVKSFAILPTTDYVKGTNMVTSRHILNAGVLSEYAKNITTNDIDLKEFLNENNDIHIDNFFTYIYTLIAMKGSVVYGHDEISLVKRLTAIKTQDLDTFKSPYIKEIQNFVIELRKDPNREKLFTFMRKSNKDKIAYLNNEVLNENIIPSDLILNPKHFKKGPLKDQYIKTMEYLKQFSVKEAITADIDFLNTTNFTHLTVQDYTEILSKLGINLSTYRKLKSFDVLLVGDKVSIKPVKSSRIKKSISLNTERSAKYKKNKLQLISPKVTARLSKFLNARFKNSTVKIMSKMSAQIKYPEIDINQFDNAFVNVGNNTIILIKERATLDVMLHEMGHLYLAELRDKDLSLYRTLMSKMETSDIFAEVIDTYSEKNNYNKEDLLEEAFVITLQRLHSTSFIKQFNEENVEQLEGILTKGGKFLGRIANFFNSLFQDFFGIKKRKNVSLDMNDSIIDIMNKVGNDLIFNKNSMLHDISRKDKRNLKLILEDKNMTEQQAVDYLIKKGLIRKICN